jgi:transcription elongation GreA/GreB family factor
VEPPQDASVARFGSTVTVDREDGRRQTFRVVGEDEADPTAGAISYVSPLAAALMGTGGGDTVMIAGAEVEIVAIR